MEWLEGPLEKVLWSSDRTGFAVIRVGTADHSVMAIGPLATLAEREPGTLVTLEGSWEQHPVHGRQFRAAGFLENNPQTLYGLRVWLGSAGIRGVGDALAGRLVDRFGLDLPAVIRDRPELLREVEGIGRARSDAIQEAWSRDEGGRALLLLLRGLGVSQRIAQRIQERYGENAHFVVTRQPYRLAEEIAGVGFRTADLLARAQGLPDDDPARVRAAAVHVLDQASDQGGHCFLTRRQLAEGLVELGVPILGLDEAIASAEGAGRVAVDPADEPAEDRVYPAELYLQEVEIARDLLDLGSGGSPSDAEARIRDAERWENVELDPSQRRAVALAMAPGVSVITGGPGTGKTTLLKVALRVYREEELVVKVASPTGRAARRSEEATGVPASTLHRLLELDPSTNRFGRGRGQPLEADVVVVDEASMLDVPLANALLGALAPAARLVLVGDVDQLPSVGPGQVLRDIIDSGAVPVSRLTTLHRQAAGSGLVLAAQAVLAGRVPESGEISGSRDVFLVARSDAEEALGAILKIVGERLGPLGFDPHVDVQVLAPTRRGPLGTERLNRELQARLNPEGPALTRGESVYRVGDRVICTKNRYDVEVFNGDIGRILEANDQQLTIRFDGRTVSWDRSELAMLDLAYAITVHKSQGSEYPAVVLALHSSHSIMLQRNLFYTAITRPKRFLCVVGNPEAWGRAARSVGGNERNTRLRARLSVSRP
jgi:exodeoxyribonuclease V alpha subunit